MTTKNFEDLVKTILTKEEISEAEQQAESEVKRLKNSQSSIRSNMKYTYTLRITPNVQPYSKYTLATPYGTVLGNFNRLVDALSFLQEHYKTKEISFIEDQQVIVRSNVKDDSYEQHTLQ